MATQADALAWINGGWRQSQYLTNITGSGWGIDFDGFYGHQCADFPNGYSANFGWGRFAGDAWQFFDTAPANWQRVQDPQPGDVFVLANAYNNGGGHTGCVTSARSRQDWTAISQNFINPSPTIGSPPSTQNYTDYQLRGFLRPPLTQGVIMDGTARPQDLQKVGFTFEGIDPSFDYSPWVGQPLQQVLDEWWQYENTRLYLTKVTQALAGTGITLSTASNQQLIAELSKRLG